jgi:two-component system, chemotaxis family, sensor histidine kinase and response regulator PixL
MHTDEHIRQQGYIYFLAEAPELLETIEQELFTLSEEFSIAKVHTLMRATHTLKGGAANVGLEIIKTIAHSLEDVFKALYNPDLATDNQIQTLVLQAYECLRLAITAEITGTTIDGEELLQRATLVFAQLQEKLGDAFGAEHQIPTSEELGFDLVQSIFEVGVQQRLKSMTETIQHPPNNAEFRDFLTSQAEVFIGLAESLNLPGFGAIAQTILAAITANPEKISQIAQVALANLQQAHAAVLAGDRVSGGEVSPDLQALAIVNQDDSPSSSENSLNTSLKSDIKDFYQFLTTIGNNKNQPLQPAKAKFYLKVIRYIFGWFHHHRQIPKQDLSLSLLVFSSNNHPVSYIENWLREFLDFVQEPGDREGFCIYRQGIILTIILAIVRFYHINEENNSDILIIKQLQDKIIKLAKAYQKYPPVNTQEKNWLDNHKLQELLVFKEIYAEEFPAKTDSLIETIWGNPDNFHPTDTVDSHQQEIEVKSDASSNPPAILEAMTDSVTQVKQQLETHPLPSPTANSRQHSFVRVDVEGLQRLNYLAGELLIYHKRRMLHDEQIQVIIEQLTQRLTRQQTTLNKLGDLPLQIPKMELHHTQNFAAVNFDALEMDVYTEFQTTLHEAIEETLQLQETTESLELVLTQATQIAEKKQNLILNIIDNLVEARMLPLGNILNRFSQMVTKLSNVYGKRVTLQLDGTDVLVDKAIAEKLYEPLLHLVRNAFDHGIEPPQVRRELGKPEQGLIEIRAYHQGSQTMIAVRDDGQGINVEAIRQKAIELNLTATNDETELFNLMFSVGFSTAHQVSEISGRGMGLDIVHSQLQALNGSISVQSSPQQGTTFLLKIPFSMTTDKLMLVQAGGIVYALLLDSIEKILIPTTQQIKEFEGKKVLHWHTDQAERMIVIRQISELMSYNSSLMHTATLSNSAAKSTTSIVNNPVLLLRHNQEVFGLEVDQIIGEQELVIRPLGNSIAPPKYIYGCSSLANGTLILVIDAALLLVSAEMPATESTQSLAPSTYIDKTSTPPNQLLSPKSKLPKVILIVDDAISLRQTLTLTLQKSGYQVLQAQNGAEALEQLQLHPEIQVVISDLEMPRMNGFELLSHMRQNPNLAHLPVVILTSRSAEKHRQLAQGLGANAYLNKPYLEDTFLDIVGSLMNMHGNNLADLVSSN